MMHDHVIPKPESIDVYMAHQLIEDLTEGARPPFADMGDHLLVRGPADLTDRGRAVPEVKKGDVFAFELIASCGTKTKGKIRYFPRHDWRSRRAWLETRAIDAGFEVRALSVRARSEQIARRARVIHIDRTQFTGILKVTDASAFRLALEVGFPGPGRAFGRGMIRIQ
ncbi:type I-E CRISPR-associated protein Cas6/Cse3/CasE [Rhodobacterales bacterium HKCCSP123]|nr:type I-E CRISPR-associated protein Cas6/Cse3/CasE [Rhodobacterales bacterium HKCCSP123]